LYFMLWKPFTYSQHMWNFHLMFLVPWHKLAHITELDTEAVFCSCCSYVGKKSPVPSCPLFPRTVLF
jgi:hypothetical protein